MSGSNQPPHRGPMVWLAVAIIAAAVIFCLVRRSAVDQPKPLIPPAAPVVSPGDARTPSAPAPPASGSIISPNGEEASHVADLLNSPKTDIHSDLRIVNELFDQYRSAVHGPNPVGENAEIVKVLTGKNSLDYYFLPPHHPAINAAGQLVDRWGTPFFFHQLSADQMQIRSAGPDGKMYTADDEVLTPGLYPPHL